MSALNKISVITGTLGNIGDRFVTSGYGRDLSFEEKLKQLKTVEGLGGVELCFSPDNDEGDATQVKFLLEKYGMFPSGVNAPLATHRKWQKGSFTANEESMRREAIETARITIDFARKIGSPLVNLWLGQDGFDYPFQVDYSAQWDRLVQCVRECADYDKSMRLALEFKPREPKNRCLLDSWTTTMLFIKDINRDNVGMTIDVGHVLCDKRSMAQAVELAGRSGKLYNLHLNDNYSDWDDDLIVGSVHLIENIELYYALHKIKYADWLSIDIFPFRDNGIEATRESVEVMKSLDRMIQKLGYDKLGSIIAAGNPVEALRYVRQSLY